MSQKVSHYKKINWATVVNINENSTLEEFKDWCFKNKYIPANTKYALLRFLLSFASEILFNQNVADFCSLLTKKGYVKQGDLKEAINIMLLYSMNKMPNDRDF